MRYSQILFSERKAICPAIAAGGARAAQTVKPKIYFEIAAREDCDVKLAKPAKQSETKRTRESFFGAASGSQPPRVGFAERAFSRSAHRVPAKIEPKQLFETLLVYLDRIVSFDEMFENLEKMNRAVKAENAGDISAIACDCADLCRDCEMLAALESLLELAGVENKNQMARAAFLFSRIKNEYERSRSAFNGDLRRLAATGKYGGFVSV